MVADQAALSDERKSEILRFLEGLAIKRKCLPFLYPVDPIAMNLPDYHLIVKSPMDLTTLRVRLSDGEYDTNMGAFFTDLELIWLNCQLYNPRALRINRTSQDLQQECLSFERRFWRSWPFGPPASRRSHFPTLSIKTPNYDSPSDSRDPTIIEREKLADGLWKKVAADPEGCSKLLEKINCADRPWLLIHTRNPDRCMLDLNQIPTEIFWDLFNSL